LTASRRRLIDFLNLSGYRAPFMLHLLRREATSSFPAAIMLHFKNGDIHETP
jgi:hypothetical protein